MFTNASFFKNLFFFFFRLVSGNPKVLHRSFSSLYSGQTKYQRYPSLAHRTDLSSKTLVFNVEQTLLKSSSLFPYFMLVAFEAGSIFRAFLLFLLYPFVCLVDRETGLKIMVMVSFLGVKKENFRVGRAVLPKFFLEDVGLEAFEVLKRGGKKVAVSEFPQVMIESFLRDYLEIDIVVGRELKSVYGYFTGVMEEKNKEIMKVSEKIISQDYNNVVGISRFNRSLDDHQLFSHCKEIYLVRESDKRSWQELPRDKYPNPLIFHDGRLAIKPTPLSSLALFMWLPFSLILAGIRLIAALTLPYKISIPILAFSGIRCTLSNPNNNPLKSQTNTKKGLLFVCNHRTLLDPLYLSFSLNKYFTAVTYSLSRMSEILSPIRTVRLTRNRDKDAMMMEKLLSQGDLVVCPEGTTCREPYLLRFSPLFAEMSEEIIPVALDTHVSMFYGTTAGGLKCLDPIFFLMNPLPSYMIQVLDQESGLLKRDDDKNGEDKSRFDVANHVQSEIGKALGFECTNLTRRDKYLILAGNEGFTT
ncbi:probable glycerol-3-phosphate acyltransferase 3 [Mercurialis annua]|uniref:probable glycerol-3-phosphate acyltransferase 3 n=1 Tax=Mercurialis annua TaxID=3986 RepID=UPI00215E479E|nr:probable glycerol-3-phosphate acyltransferase 3 [Mercurialis annua]